MKKVLLISPDTIAKKMTGPGIRYFNFAVELSKNFNVTLYIPNSKTDFNFQGQKFNLIKGNKDKLIVSAYDSDSIVVQGIAFRLYPFLKKIKKPIVVDIYDPITLENLELRKFISLKDRLTYHETDLDLILEQLSLGDYFICSSEKQKDYWLGMLAAINRVNPITYNDNIQMKKLIGVVPFGFDNKGPIKTKQVLKGVWPNINKEDKVIIWGGGIWNWFDPLTLIEAMNVICKKRKDIKLFFMGIGHPNMKCDITVAEECIKKSKEYGLFNKNIFFNDWVEYSERQNFLMEADLGVSTYFNNLETRFSFRTRILDYLWCELPMALTRGDYMSELVESNKLGFCYNEGEYDELASIIIKILDDKEIYKLMKFNIKMIKEQFMWNNVTKPLMDFCSNPYISSDKVKKVKIFYSSNGLIKYYLIRIKSKIKSFIKKIIKYKLI
ncbi:glycosyltransferase [Clostridium pasteurianum]|uniref:Glycosyltransferase n=1 Tax=Clostridium pasteurianum BC1 TaxID=86416 RepID=R4KE26_CLOPA|nr:glycosyltransferase [Clostridium pasteurianum]AGK97870.1 glycosyltransferase [Clostridium pasteurianum BC1]